MRLVYIHFESILTTIIGMGIITGCCAGKPMIAQLSHLEHCEEDPFDESQFKFVCKLRRVGSFDDSNCCWRLLNTIGSEMILNNLDGCPASHPQPIIRQSGDCDLLMLKQAVHNTHMCTMDNRLISLP